MSPLALFNSAFGWLWRNKLFLGVIVFSTFLFTLWNFPFNDLSDAVTSAVSRATGNQVYVQAEQLNIHLIPQPAVSANNLHVETTMPPIEAKWAKVTPGLFSILFSMPTIIKAASGNPEAGQALGSKLSVDVDAEGVLGGDVSLSMGAGKKGESGKERSRVVLKVDEVNLKDVGQWADLPVNLQGRLELATDMQFSPDMQEQPDGDFELRMSKFNMPAGTVNVPMGEASLPISLPALSLQNVTFKGRMAGGNLIIEEGLFGQSKDPLFGRIKGNINMRLYPTPQGVVPQFGQYNLTVDLNTNATVQKELGFAFLLLDSAKDPQAGGGAKYLFRASGQGLGMMAGPPSITRVSSF
jgi:type II secretion system protein N